MLVCLSFFPSVGSERKGGIAPFATPYALVVAFSGAIPTPSRILQLLKARIRRDVT